VAVDADLKTAVREAKGQALSAEISEKYLVQALSSAHAKAIDAIT